MERKMNHPRGQRLHEMERKKHEQEQPIELDAYSGEELLGLKDDLVKLRLAGMGGTIEEHQKWIETKLGPDYFGFLHTHNKEVVGALLGKPITIDRLPLNIREYIGTYSNEAPDRPILWCNNLITHPSYQGKGLAGKCLSRFSEYAESYYRYSGAFLACRIRQQNFASESSFARVGFKPTGVFDLEDFGNDNFTNFQFWLRAVPPLHSREGEIFIPESKREQLQTSSEPYYQPPHHFFDGAT